MGIFRRRSRLSSQFDDDFSLWQRFREDFSQSSELVERVAAWVGDSWVRLLLFGLVTVLVVVGFMLLSILFFGAPQGADRDFIPISMAWGVPSGTVEGGLL